MKRVCIIDGGGARGVIALAVIKQIERKVGKPFYEIFDLVVGTSVGAVIGGPLCTGEVSADDYYETVLETIPALFKKRWRVPFLQPKYSRRPFIESYSEHVDPTTRMCECKTMFMCTSVNIVDARTHYFKSWEKKDGELNLLSAINRSYAAPWYFGALVDKKTRAVWIDGGCGNESSPQQEAYIETLRQEWTQNERVHILAIGCGQADFGVPFNKARRYKNFRQTFYLIYPSEGGLARIQADKTQTELIKTCAQKIPSLTYQRVEKYDLPKKIDKMDGAKYVAEYAAIGEELAKTIEYKFLS